MGASGFNKDVMCLVVFREGTNVPTISGVFAPDASTTGFDMELYSAANWCKWQLVIVKWVMVIGIC